MGQNGLLGPKLRDNDRSRTKVGFEIRDIREPKLIMIQVTSPWVLRLIVFSSSLDYDWLKAQRRINVDHGRTKTLLVEISSLAGTTLSMSRGTRERPTLTLSRLWQISGPAVVNEQSFKLHLN